MQFKHPNGAKKKMFEILSEYPQRLRAEQIEVLFVDLFPEICHNFIICQWDQIIIFPAYFPVIYPYSSSSSSSMDHHNNSIAL